MNKKFEKVPGDERATARAFEDFMGGYQRAERINRVWNDSYPGCDSLNPTPKVDNFIANAIRAGFTFTEINAFLSL